MNRKMWVVWAGALLVIAGCSSTPTAKDIAKDEVAATEVREKSQVARTQREQARAQAYMEKVPKWVVEPPKGDGDVAYAVGVGQSSKMDLAQKKAALEAQFELAKGFKQALSGSERQYRRDNGKAGVDERFTLLIDQVVDRVPLAGYEVVRRETLPIDGAFHSFVLMKASYSEMQRVLAERSSERRDRSIDEQFDELERRLKEHRKERDAAKAEVAASPPVSDPGTALVGAR